jgi:hypothetical protein
MIALYAFSLIDTQTQVLEKNWGREHSKGNKTVPAKVATTCTEDGHQQTTKAGTALYTKRTKEPGTTEEEMD